MNGSRQHHARQQFEPPQLERMRIAAESLISCYCSLQASGGHLLSGLMEGGPPIQWEHYPADDVIDKALGYQFFYHSHSPLDRDPSLEHGHFHLFARMEQHAAGVDQLAEQRFLAALDAAPAKDASTVNLLCISVNETGVPIRLFTVNRWVTGGHLLSAEATLKLLDSFSVDTEHHRAVADWLKAMLVLFRSEIQRLLAQRDKTLRELALRQTPLLLENESAEILSSMSIDIDRQIASLVDCA
ncbi:hypothetical protein H3H36_02210 [Duganella sp. FT3S]|uniref:DUF6969 domain-containing protein n=1 Tax=Rugamonas fusca TaxID=2758568 RepID=A0A7W2I588_9BURK|nr:hypothetical protein [Rugamonas fusca]MBA5604176.1 hypothetical protein [Rugamonas fusca]